VAVFHQEWAARAVWASERKKVKELLSTDERR